MPFVGGCDPGGGYPVFGVDVGDDGMHRLPAEPVDESSGTSLAMPLPCHGVPTTQAIPAMSSWPEGLTVAWTVPVRQDSSRSRITQFSQETAGSGELAVMRW